MKRMISCVALTSVFTLSGCASTSGGGENLPENPLANGYALISLCGPNDRERAGNHFDFECGKGLTLRKIDNENPSRFIKRDKVYVLPGHHQVRIEGGISRDFSFNVQAGKIYQLTTHGKVLVFSNDPELVRQFENRMNIHYRSGYYREQSF